MSIEQKPLVDIRGLKVAFRSGRSETTVLHGVDLTVAKGEILGVIGESGSGKTMTGMALLRLLPGNAKVEAQALRFDGQELEPLSDADFAPLRGLRLAMIFQDPVGSFNPSKRIGWHFEHILKRAGKSTGDHRAQAVRLMQDVGIKRAEESIDLYPHQLSGGMLQRALIALVLALEPELIVADEPTTNLDKVVERQILSLFRDLQTRLGAAIIFVTHDMAVAAGLCDRIAVMNAGELVEVGPTRQIFTAPNHPYTRLLIDTAVELARGGKDGARLTSRIGTTEGPAARAKLSDAPLMTLDRLDMTFPGRGGRAEFKALDGISLDLKQGEILGLVGESGSGKTTLGRAMLRLYEPTGGALTYKGRDITHASEGALRPIRRELQMVFQDPGGSFNPRKTMRASLTESLKAAGTAKTEIPGRIDALLTRVGLTPAHGDRFAHELSGGQLQRVAIARAISLNPSLIVADEAVSKLDVSVRAGVLNLFKDIQAETGMSMIFITHDLDVARYMCDRIAVLFHGRLLEIGPTAQIFDAPAHDYTRTLLASQHTELLDWVAA